MADALTATPTTKIRRMPDRGRYDRETIYQILDDGFLCHISFVANGRPCVIPTIYWRHENHVYWHGSSAGRMDKQSREDGEVCFCVAHIDGLVLARSAFHHSVNFRSVMIYGKPQAIDDPEAKLAGMHEFVEGLFPGRMSGVRPPSPIELKATMLMSLSIDEASAKVRTGPPIDKDSDMDRPVWAGVIPLGMHAKAPETDPQLSPKIEVPDYAVQFRGLSR